MPVALVAAVDHLRRLLFVLPEIPLAEPIVLRNFRLSGLRVYRMLRQCFVGILRLIFRKLSAI